MTRLDRLKSAFEQSQEEDAPIWMTVYSDMMTNLMLFFLMMFAFNLAGEEYTKKASESFKRTVQGDVEVLEADGKDASEVPLDEFIHRLAEKEKDLQVIEKGEGVRLRLPEPVLFDPGRADLKPEAERLLKEISRGLKNLPNSLVIEGHTDDVPVRSGVFKSNWELSEARAENVLEFLIREGGIPPHRLAVAGFGEHWPFMANDSPMNRALNRRIEILVLNDEKK